MPSPSTISALIELITEHIQNLLNPHQVSKTQVGLSNVQNTLNNFSATANPGPSNSSTFGYSIGSEWLNLTTDQAFACLDATPGAAIWKSTTMAGGLPPVMQEGQVIFSADGVSFAAELPLTSEEGWLVDDEGILIVVG